MDATPNATRFETEIARYNRWREELTQSVHAYHDWLESSGQLDVQQSIRFYDLLENLNKGRLMLAFLAEFSRGKSELINALFFSSFKERLLPSDVGRTTMCPTEIFHDPSEEPYLKLLSVETRYRDESISQLKNMPVEWSKVRLNTSSAADMKKALKALADTKKVYALEARMLGLAPMVNEKGELPGEEELVEVPAWRYAMINYPHPLLSNGLSILDTPGLNALGMEPELTVSTVPNAHAILFLLSIDTGVTKSDLEIWDRYVKPGLPQKIAVLNKIDLMWDELKTPAEIEKAIARMVENTSQHLQLPKDRIFAISAQKALLAKVREDAGLLKRSGLEELEKFLADSVVPMKRQILCRAVVNEIGGMMNSSRASIAKKQQGNQAEIDELNGLVGKSREVVTKLWQKITSEKNAYNAALAEYKVNHGQFNQKRAALLEMLNPQRLDQLLSENAASMGDSWFTAALQKSMRDLTREMSDDFERVFMASEDIKKMMQGVYNTFTEKFGFQKMNLPALDLDPHRTKLKLLVHETDAFARDPVNVAHYKGPFVKKFYGTLVRQARNIFTEARTQSERWGQAVTLPLEVQIKDHKQQLQSRLDNLSKINEKTTSINEQMAILKAAQADLLRQRNMIEGLLARVTVHEATADLQEDHPATVTTPNAPRQVPPELMQTTKLATFEAPKPRPPAPPPKPAEPLISDDLLAQIGKPVERPVESKLTATAALSPEDGGRARPSPLRASSGQPPGADRTVRMDVPGVEHTQRLNVGEDRTVRTPPGPESTQRLPTPKGAESTQRLATPQPPGAERTQQLDPLATQRLDASTTQPLEDSIRRLQEAKRLLQKD